MAACLKIYREFLFKTLIKFKHHPCDNYFNKNRILINQINRYCSSKRLNSLQICMENVRKYDYENYLCSLLLSEPARTASFVIRAFNVEVSQVRDLVSTSAIGQMRMQFWKDTIDKTFSGHPPEQPVALELSKLLKQMKLTKTWFLRLINSRETLLNDKPLVSMKDLENYCNNSSVPVYLLILQAIGYFDVQCNQISSHIGTCQGICNMLRGIPFNASKRRLYLPLELVSKHKISQDALYRGDVGKLSDAVYDLSSVAYQHLNMARKLDKDIPKHVKLVFLPAVSCEQYLKSLEKSNFDVFHPSNQTRNNWLPLKLLKHKFQNKF